MSRTNWFKFLKLIFDQLLAATGEQSLVDKDLLMQTVAMNVERMPLVPLGQFNE